MATKPNYIALINAFWKRYYAEDISQSIMAVYLCLLDCINRNRWEPVRMTDRELAEKAKISLNKIFKLKRELMDLGLIDVKVEGERRLAKTFYSLPQSESLTPVESQSDEILTPQQSQNPDTLTPVLTPQQSQKPDTLTPVESQTHHNIYNKTYTIDKPVKTESAPAHARGQSLICFDKNLSVAQSQSAEIYNHVFGQGDSPLMEQFCINNRFTPDQVRQAARAVLAEWQLTGVTHTDTAGRLDYSDAIRHLFNTMRYRLNDIVRRPKTREELRAELLGAAAERMRRAIENPQPYAPRVPQPDDPF